jgi:hypothetical protein
VNVGVKPLSSSRARARAKVRSKSSVPLVATNLTQSSGGRVGAAASLVTPPQSARGSPRQHISSPPSGIGQKRKIGNFIRPWPIRHL